MSAPRLRRAFAVCAVTPADRALRAIGAVVLAGFAVTVFPNLWCTIPAGICATLLAVGAITGWCPTALITRAPAEPAENTLGVPEARQRIDV